MVSCAICGHAVDGDEFERCDTGDFHGACFDSLRTAGVGLKNCVMEQTECRMCSQRIARGGPVVEFFGIGGVAHLACFFATANGRARSVGAGVPSLSTVERGRTLRQRSDALLALSRRLAAARLAGYPRLTV